MQAGDDEPLRMIPLHVADNTDNLYLGYQFSQNAALVVLLFEKKLVRTKIYHLVEPLIS